MKIIKASKTDLLIINDIYNSDIRKFILGKYFKKKTFKSYKNIFVLVDDNQRVGFLKISGVKVYLMTRYNIDISIYRLLNLMKSSIYFKKKFRLHVTKLLKKDLTIKKKEVLFV